MPQVSFKRGNKQFIDSLPIVDGQLVYNTETGETFEDVGGKRIPTGGKSADATLDKTSTNPIQNKPVTEAIYKLNESKADKAGAYELIDTITTKTAVPIKLDTEPDGTPYNFERVKVKILLPVATYDAPGSFQFRTRFKNGALGPYYQGNYLVGSTGTKKAYIIEGYKHFGFWETKSSYGSGNITLMKPDYDLGFNTSMEVDAVAAPTIGQIITVGNLPSGTEVKVYAVRGRTYA